MENKHIQISIIIPIFNEEKTIIQVLERISKVIKPNVTYETIVINDGSTDGTLSLLEKNVNLYDQLISYEKNYGKGNAVNKGLNISNGQYIFFHHLLLELVDVYIVQDKTYYKNDILVYLFSKIKTDRYLLIF